MAATKKSCLGFLTSLKGTLICLSMTIFRLIGAENCGSRSFINDPNLNGKWFVEGLLLKITDEITIAECVNNCYHLSECNMFTVNTETDTCRLHSVPYSGGNAQSGPGNLYFAVACDDLKINPVCTSHLYEPLANPINPAQCHQPTGWVTAVPTIQYCRQTLWENPTDVSFYFPSPPVPGVTITVRGARNAGSDTAFSVRAPGSPPPDTILLRVLPDDSMRSMTYDGTGWASDQNIGTFTLAYGVEFDLLATFTASQYQVSLNGAVIATDTIFNPLPEATYLFVHGFSSVSNVQIIYP